MDKELPQVKWGDILPLLPKQWQKIGKPFPIPGGALILVSYSVRGVGQLYVVTLYATPVPPATLGKIYDYKPYGGEEGHESPASFNSRDARRKIANFAEWEIENGSDYSAGEADRYHEDGED